MIVRPELSVIVVAYECKYHLLALLDDLDAARETIHLEVFIVDNASTDDIADEVAARFPWVEFEVLSENIGFARANNRAIARVRADVVALLNPDTRVDATALRGAMTELGRSSDVGILSPRVIDGAGRFDRRCMRGFPTVWGVTCHVTGLDRALAGRGARRYLQRWLPEDEAADVEAVSGAVMFCRTEALHAVSGFDERFFIYGEDIDLCADSACGRLAGAVLAGRNDRAYRGRVGRVA